jgi:hypothetical protein
MADVHSFPLLVPDQTFLAAASGGRQNPVRRDFDMVLLEEKSEFSERRGGSVAAERPMRPFFERQWLDVLDRENTWLEAQVLESEEKTERIYVHYKGYGSDHEEWLMSDPNHPDVARIRPLHTHTRPQPRVEEEFKLMEGMNVDILDSSDNWLPVFL